LSVSGFAEDHPETSGLPRESWEEYSSAATPVQDGVGRCGRYHMKDECEGRAEKHGLHGAPVFVYCWIVERAFFAAVGSVFVRRPATAVGKQREKKGEAMVWFLEIHAFFACCSTLRRIPRCGRTSILVLSKNPPISRPSKFGSWTDCQDDVSLVWQGGMLVPTGKGPRRTLGRLTSVLQGLCRRADGRRWGEDHHDEEQVLDGPVREEGYGYLTRLPDR
jgi:hypothetical protein